MKVFYYYHNETVGPSYSTFFIRPTHRLPIHPNFITTLSKIAGIGCVVCFALGTPVLIIIAPILYILGHILDQAGGELARLPGKSSTFGHYYDHAAGAMGYLSLFIGLGIGLSGEVIGAYAIRFGIPAGVASVLTMGVRMLIEARSGVMESGDDLLLMDADVLYDVRMLRLLTEAAEANTLLINRDFEECDEPVKVGIIDGRIVEFRKRASGLYDMIGESVVFFSFSS